LKLFVSECSGVIVHLTYAEQLSLMMANHASGDLYQDAPPLIALQCLRAGLGRTSPVMCWPR
jgi:hypothetical protein